MAKKNKNKQSILRKSGYKAVPCCWNCNGRYLAYADETTFMGHRCVSTKLVVKFDHICDKWVSNKE